MVDQDGEPRDALESTELDVIRTGATEKRPVSSKEIWGMHPTADVPMQIPSQNDTARLKLLQEQHTNYWRNKDLDRFQIYSSAFASIWIAPDTIMGDTMMIYAFAEMKDPDHRCWKEEQLKALLPGPKSILDHMKAIFRGRQLSPGQREEILQEAKIMFLVTQTRQEAYNKYWAARLAPFGLTLDQIGALDSRLVLPKEVADFYPRGIPAGKIKSGKELFIRVIHQETISYSGDVLPSEPAAPTGQPAAPQSSPSEPTHEEIMEEIHCLQQEPPKTTQSSPSDEEIDTEIKRLQQKGAPAAGGPSDKAGAKKSPAEMTDEELLKELNR